MVGFGTAAAQMGLNAMSQISNNAINMGFQHLNSDFQLDMYRKQLELNNIANLRDMQNQKTLQQELYKTLYSPIAQLEFLKTAGISPAIAFANGIGTQGTSVNSGGENASMQPTPMSTFPAATIADTMLKQAEIEKIQAETDEIRGNTPTAQANIAEKWANAGYKKAATSYEEAQTYFQNLQNIKFEDTYNTQIQEIISNSEEAAWNAKKAYFEADNAGLLYKLNTDTYDSITAERLNKANLAFWQSQLTEKQIELTDAQVHNLEELTKKFGQEILQDWKKLQLEETSIKNQKDFWNKNVQIRLNEYQNEVNKVYYEYTQKEREETHRHDEKQRELDWYGYKAILQAIGLTSAIEAKGNKTVTIEHKKSKP